MRPRLKDVFVCRPDLANHGITMYYYAKDFGYIIRRGLGHLSWWASNDVCTENIGVLPNRELCRPTLGPFTSFDAAFISYCKVMKAARKRMCTILT